MKYCINYFDRKFRELNNYDEITVKFNPSDKTLVKFIQTHENQRVNIYIHDNQDFIDNNRIELFEAIQKQNPDLKFVLKLRPYREELTRQVFKIIKESEYNFKYFFSTFATNFDIFWGLMELEPTDIYIVEELGFYAKQCGELAHERNIQIRAFPNVAQSAWRDTPEIKKFFIRPEDVSIYEPYIDVFEFYGESCKFANTNYKIYTKENPHWFGKLNELIIGFNGDTDSRCLLDNFAERRVQCGKRCLKGRKCEVCTAMDHLAESLHNKNLILTKITKKKGSEVIN